MDSTEAIAGAFEAAEILYERGLGLNAVRDETALRSLQTS